MESCKSLSSGFCDSSSGLACQASNSSNCGLQFSNSLQVSLSLLMVTGLLCTYHPHDPLLPHAYLCAGTMVLNHKSLIMAAGHEG